MQRIIRGLSGYERGEGGSVSPPVVPYITSEPAPQEFEWCIICRMKHHPKWHQPLWREERRAAGDRRALTRHTPDRRGGQG